MKIRANVFHAERLIRQVLAALLLSGAAWASDSPVSQGENRVAVQYSHQQVKEIPWDIHIVKVDRHKPDLRWVTSLGQGTRQGTSVLSDQIKQMPPSLGKPMAAINGDFFKGAGDPEGVQIVSGELISAPVSTRSCMWIDANGAPRMTNVAPHFFVTWPDRSGAALLLNEERPAGTVVLYTPAFGPTTRCAGGVELLLERSAPDAAWMPLQVGKSYVAKVRSVNRSGNSPLKANSPVLSIAPDIKLPAIQPGDSVRFSTATTPDMCGATTAIGGGPALVRNSKALPFKGLQPRHPRSAVGWNDDFFFLVEVDGRQRQSAGMTMAELATYMSSLGCVEALNLDGGGSATLWVYGAVVNSPSEGRERPAANALVVVQDSSPAAVATKP